MAGNILQAFIPRVRAYNCQLKFIKNTSIKSQLNVVVSSTISEINI